MKYGMKSSGCSVREAQECIAGASSAVREDRDFLEERTSKLRATGEGGVSHMYGVRRVLGRRNTRDGGRT